MSPTIRRRLPASVRSDLDIQPGERPLAWEQDEQGKYYVGTNRALHLPEHGGFRRVLWEDVERADWQGNDNTLTVVETAAWGEVEPQTVVVLPQPGRLVDLIHERVTKSVVVTVYAPVYGRSGLTVVGRASPDGDVDSDHVVWSYVLSPDLDPEDPVVREVAEETLLEAEAQVGLR